MTETDTDETPKKGWFARLREGLSKSSKRLVEGIGGLFTKRRLDDATLEELEELLITADLGVETATKLSAELASTRFDKEVSADEIRNALAAQVTNILEPVATPLPLGRTSSARKSMCLRLSTTSSTPTNTTTTATIAISQRSSKSSPG